MNCNLEDILRQFDVEFEPQAYGNGHINDTYIVQSTPRYILQRINTEVFKKPIELMDNVKAITEFLRGKIKENGGNPDRETLTLVNTIDDKTFYKTEDGLYFRMYKFIDNAKSYEVVENPDQFYNAARAFGKFQNMLADFPAKDLFETIPNFHNTRKRFEDFKVAVNDDKANRAKEVTKEINFSLEREKYVDTVVDLLKNGELPTRVTHNDTKLNNVLLDDKTGEAVCVVDLDTVMPGSLLYDFGDALRFGASTGSEDEKDLDKIWFDLNLFEVFTKGFLEELGDSITKKEIELLPFSAILMTYECGIRFLGDYLNGDVYFKVDYPEHNLDRARTQFKLVYDMETKMEEMIKIVNKLVNED